MNGNLRLAVSCCCIAGLASAAFGHPYEPRMFWVPLGADPSDYAAGTTVVFAEPGDTVPMSLYVQGPDGYDFLTTFVQAFFTTTLNPSGGPVQTGQVIADCSSAAIDPSHPDLIGFGRREVFAEPELCPSLKAGFVLFNLAAPFQELLPANPDGVYFGQIDWIVDAGACGEFVASYIGAPDSETMIGKDNNGPPVGTFTPLVIVVESPPNDRCEDATVAAVGTPVTPGVTPYDTTCGAQDGPTPSCGASGADVFFEVTTTCHGETMIVLTGPGDFAVYDDGCTLANEIACNTGFFSYARETFTIQVIGHDAVGDLLIDCRPLPCTDASDCDDFDLCTYDECADQFCQNSPRLYGDINGDGIVGVFDIFCILNLIAGEPAEPIDPECEPVNADIADLRGECGPNGVVNVLDVFGVLDMIAGVDPCCSPQLTGACCTAGVCTDGVTHADCYYGHGFYMGDGTDCGSVTCP